MKTTLTLTTILLFGLASAQNYKLQASVFDGGGRPVGSTIYRCSFSIGQHIASRIVSSGSYCVTLGFWHQPYAPDGVTEEVGQSTSSLVFMLTQNAPNPFGRQTAIRYSLPKECDVALRVYNSTGRVVTTLVRGKQKPGRYTVSWDVSSVPAARLPCGTYFCRLEAGDFVAVRKMVKTE